MNALSESALETVTLAWFASLGYEAVAGEALLVGGERTSYADPTIRARLLAAVSRLNSHFSPEEVEDGLRRLLRTDSPTLVRNNAAFHAMLVEGVPVERRLPDGGTRGDTLRVVDWENPDANDWLVANQVTVQEGQHTRRADVVVFLNGLPVAVLELKNPADADADIWKAFAQLQTYKAEVPSLFLANGVLAISDGLQARLGTLTADRERFAVWRTVDGGDVAPPTALQLETLVRGVFDKRRFLDLLRHFIVFEDDGKGRVEKKVAGYHQFHAVQIAVERAVSAASTKGDRRCGVVWHTQGSGKSLTMVFFAGKLVAHPVMENPTLVVLTDRNDLDGQLYGTFARCAHLLHQKPAQAESRAHLRTLLSVASGGVVFTTIQKFAPEERGDKHPELSPRHNIVVIADEAHRSQYDFLDGFARHLRDALPNASFIGFTGTPIEKTDANTRAVFGDYIDVYDIARAVEDKATVPIYYESRLAKLGLLRDATPKLDAEFEEVTEGEEPTAKERAKSKWTALEALVGSTQRLAMVAKDLVDHWETRLSAMDGKAMVVCMSRRICMDLHDQLVKLRPEWFHADDDKGVVKVVMTGSADEGPRVAMHARSKDRREKLAEHFKDPAHPFKLVIVRDMWLTGFDAPCLHTMYVDKPMHGHGLMQAIARVNRVFKDKPGGLVVDYLGIADSLRRALATYTESGGQGKTAIDQEEAVEAFLRNLDICRGFFHLPAPPPPGHHCAYALLCEGDSVYIGQTEDLGNRWKQHVAGTGAEWTRTHKPVRIAHFEEFPSREAAVEAEREWKSGFGRKRLKRLIESGGARQAGGFHFSHWSTAAPEEKLALLPAAQEHILAQPDGKARFSQAVTNLSKAFALAVPAPEVLVHRDEVAFFQAVRAALAKTPTVSGKSADEIEHAVRQLVEKAIAPEGVLDVCAAAGLKRPDISILSEEFLAEVRGLPHRNLAVELLQKLLKGELKTRTKRNLVQSQAFSERLEKALLGYQNRAIETAKVIEELIALAKDMREAQARGEKLGLTEDELAFYDALEANDSAVAVLGDDALRKIARELLQTVRENATIDWQYKESVRAGLRAMVRRILRKWGYPPDKAEKAAQTVLAQAELLAVG